MLGDKDRPFRCSKLAALVKCSMRIHLMEYLEVDDEGREAAQNGSLTHVGVAEFHITPGTLEERKRAAWDAIASHATKFPLADENEVRLFITPYMNDPRNIHAKFFNYDRMPHENNEGTHTLSVERQLDFTLPPHPMDTTQKPIFIQGTYDQVRQDGNGRPVLYDLKTGKPSGWEMMHDYAIQMAAYVYGCRTSIPLFNSIKSGFIIRNHGYRTRENKGDQPDGVFFSTPFHTSEQVESILENVRLHVALWRNGEVNFGPGPHCTYCDFGGLTGCLPRWEEVQQLQLKAVASAFTKEVPQ